jgi:hypothetical protein
LLVLAIPATVWIGAGWDQLFGECDWDCGDRDRGWFLFVMVTGPLIPVGAWLLSGRMRRAGVFAALLRLACLLGGACFGLLGLALLAAATGLTENGDEAATTTWLAGGLFCCAIAVALLLVRRRLPRRYPSGSWPPSGKSTSAG